MLLVLAELVMGELPANPNHSSGKAGRAIVWDFHYVFFFKLQALTKSLGCFCSHNLSEAHVLCWLLLAQFPDNRDKPLPLGVEVRSIYVPATPWMTKPGLL